MTKEERYKIINVYLDATRKLLESIDLDALSDKQMDIIFNGEQAMLRELINISQMARND